MNGYTEEDLVNRARENMHAAFDCLRNRYFDAAATHLDAARILVDMVAKIKGDGIRFTSVDISFGDGNAPFMVTIPKKDEK